MKLLLDTYIELWAVTDSPKLGAAARELIVAAENSIYVSAASVWEIAIKYALNVSSEGAGSVGNVGKAGNRAGRGDMPVSAARAAELFALSDYQPQPIDWAHTQAVSALPTLKSHADPIDRLLIAQARCEAMMLLTRDSDVAEYGERVMLV